MLCSACGEENPSSNLFCKKCAADLAKEKSRALAQRRVYMPPQHEVGHMRISQSQPSNGWLLPTVLMLAFSAFLWWVIYG